MGGFKHINVAQATEVGQYAEARQVQNAELDRLVTLGGSTGSAYICTLVLNSNSWDDGTTLIFTPNVNNTGPATITINGAAFSLLSQGGTPLGANDLIAGTPYYIRKLGVAWFTFPLTSSGGTGDYVLKTGDTMTGTLTISNPIAGSALVVAPAPGSFSQAVVGLFAPRAPGGIPYTLDVARYGTTYFSVQNTLDQRAMRMVVDTTASYFDAVPLDFNGNVGTAPSVPLVFRLVNAGSVLFNAVTIDNQGSMTVNYQHRARMFFSTNFETALSAGPVTLDMLQYQSWSLTLGGDTQFTLANVGNGQMVRVMLRSAAGRTVTWAAGADQISWPNSAGNLPPTAAQIGAGPLQCCLFTFWKFAPGYIAAQWSAY
jgi:hypothetical protein